MSSTRTIPIYILAGGQSRRFGSDKARAEINGKPLLLHVADAVRPWATRITIVAAQAGAYDDLGFETIGDQTPGCGPLGGLQTALRHLECLDMTEQWLLLTSCDWLGLQGEWINKLLRARTVASHAVAFFSELPDDNRRRWEPLLALYHRDILSKVDRMMHEDQKRAMWQLLDYVEAVAVLCPPDWTHVQNLNRPRIE